MLTMSDLQDQADRRWRDEFEWHLSIVPVLMDVLVDATLPVIPVGLGSRFDKDQITGGGYRDNMAMADRIDTGPVADARDLWDWVIGYTLAVSSWLNHDVPAPYAADIPPVVDRRVNADPLTARGLALVTAGWLIDRADRIVLLTELEDHRAEMFRTIRHLRGRYGVFNHPRRARPTQCTICGEMTVHTRWATSTDGRPRSIEVKTCSTCGDEHREDEGTRP